MENKTEQYVVLRFPTKHKIVYTYLQSKHVFTNRQRCIEEAINNRVIRDWRDPEIIELELVED